MININTTIIFLTGIKHSGKSNVGQFCADSLNIPFIDVDNLIMSSLPQKYNSIRSFYESEGKEQFMFLEQLCLKNFLNGIGSQDRYIIALGGGACDNLPLIELMNKSGTILYLSIGENTLLDRIVKKGIPPFIDKKNVKASFHDLFLNRDEKYRQLSDFVVSLADLESIESNGKLLASFISQLLGDTTWAETHLEHL